MQRSFLLRLLLGISMPAIAAFLSGCGPDSQQGPAAGLPVTGCTAFDPADVRLLEGPFRDAMELNKTSLLNYEPDRLLSKFRIEAGLEPRAEHYGGWEAMTLAGHSLGHYMSACALVYGGTGDSTFLHRAAYIVHELVECQEASGTGYIGAFPDGRRILEEEVGRGKIEASAFHLNGIWAPYYTIHKLMAGLRDVHLYCGNREALEVWTGLAGWLENALGELDDVQVSQMLQCEHGGMNEVLADLSAITGDERYLELSGLFCHREILEPLSRGEDILPGKHGNTQIPKVIGLARRYELTGNESDRDGALFFWDRVVHHHSYVNGSHGLNEYFGPPDILSDRLGSNTSESCNVYNMIKLSEHLFSWNPDARVADFIERALLNHILSSQHPADGRVLYFHSLQMGGYKEFQDPYDFTCCIGTGMENHSKYGNLVYQESGDRLYVSQFIASQLDWKEKGLVLRQETAFPAEQASQLSFLNEKPVRLTLEIRHPGWAGEGFAIRVNGRSIRTAGEPGSYVAVRGRWRKGDRIEVELPFTLRLEAMPDNPGRVAVMYGPLVLAGDLGPAGEPGANGSLYVPGIVTEAQDPAAWLQPDPPEPNAFSTLAGKPRNVALRPLYRVYDRNYTVYWDLYTEDEWSVKLIPLN